MLWYSNSSEGVVTRTPATRKAGGSLPKQEREKSPSAADMMNNNIYISRNALLMRLHVSVQH